MGFEGLDFSAVEGVSPSFVEALYGRYRRDPASVEQSWRAFFEGLQESATGPSWKRAGWPCR